MADRILIRNLLLRTRIGVNSEERRNLQDVVLNIVLDTDTRAAGASDDIEDTVNYRTISKEIIALVEASHYYLVEKMAAEIARLCLGHEGVLGVMVRVEKPGALRFAESVGIEITRTPEDFAE
jgi:D-erythro-7,8-dihydroneopterin triphosphate epimerase